MEVDRRADRALFRQLADVLREDINAGELAPGQRLPSETELIERYRVSRGTARDAIGLLRQEGLIIVEHGRGAYVRAEVQPVVRRLVDPSAGGSLSEAFERDAASQGRSATIEQLGYAKVKAPTEVSERLQLARGEKAVRTKLRFLVDGQAVQVATVWQPQGDVIETGTGSVSEELVGRMPSEDELRQLKLDQGTPVIELRRALAQGGQVVEFAIAVIAANRCQLHYDLTG